jgi:hypothetical protein
MLSDEQLRIQRGHAWGILMALNKGEEVNNLAVQMWSGFERSLCVYGITMCLEWRVGRRNIESQFGACFAELDDALKEQGYTAAKPPWLGQHEVDIQRSHRSNLIRLYPEYAEKYPGTPELMPVIWPVFVGESDEYALKVGKRDLAFLATGERKLPEWLTFDEATRSIITH